MPTGEWIARKVYENPTPPPLAAIIESLQDAQSALNKISDRKLRRHTFVVSSMIGNRPSIALVSNFERFVKGRIQRLDNALDELIVTTIRPRGPQIHITGASDAVSISEKSTLVSLIKRRSPEDEIQHAIAEVNVAASERSTTVSSGCTIGSIHSNGQGTIRPMVTEAQSGDFLPPDSLESLKAHGLQIVPAVNALGERAPLRLVGVTMARSITSPGQIRQQLKRDPKNAELWNNYGAQLAREGKFDEAISAYEKAIELSPNFVTPIANLAQQLWINKKNLEAAEARYSEAIAKTAPDVPSWISSSFAQFYDVALGDVPRALRLHEQAATDTSYPLAKARLGEFLARQLGENARGNLLIAEAETSAPLDPNVLILAGRSARNQTADLNVALNYAQRAAVLDPSNIEALRESADLLLLIGDARASIYYYRRLLKRDRNNAHIIGNFGLALLICRRPHLAIRNLSRAASLQPGNPNTLINLAAALWVNRQSNDAVAALNAGLKMGPAPEIELEAIAMLEIATQSDRQRQDRISELINSGVHAYGMTVRSMAQKKSTSARARIEKIANVIEGKVLPTW